MSPGTTIPTVKGFIQELPKEHQSIANKLVTIVKKTAPKSSAVIKYSMPTFELDGIFGYIQKSKKYLSFGFYSGVQLKDPKGQLEGSGIKLRHIKLQSTSEIPIKQLEKWIRQAVKINQDRFKKKK